MHRCVGWPSPRFEPTANHAAPARATQPTLDVLAFASQRHTPVLNGTASDKENPSEDGAAPPNPSSVPEKGDGGAKGGGDDAGENDDDLDGFENDDDLDGFTVGSGQKGAPPELPKQNRKGGSSGGQAGSGGQKGAATKKQAALQKHQQGKGAGKTKRQRVIDDSSDDDDGALFGDGESDGEGEGEETGGPSGKRPKKAKKGELLPSRRSLAACVLRCSASPLQGGCCHRTAWCVRPPPIQSRAIRPRPAPCEMPC